MEYKVPSNDELIRKFFSNDNMNMARNSSSLRMLSETSSLKRNNDYISSLDLSLVDHDTDFLQLGRGLGTQDFVGQRILQVISIIRNLSFFDENLTVLAKNKTLIRFLIMASNIRWGSIHQQALDILGNIAPEIELQDPATDTLTRCIASTVSEGLLGSDRGFIINCLEILYKLCQFEKNKYYLYKCIQQNIYDQISLYLTLNDIMLLLYTLECIYSLTALGQRTCNQIIHIKGIVPTLVSLITVEVSVFILYLLGLKSQSTDNIPGTNLWSRWLHFNESSRDRTRKHDKYRDKKYSKHCEFTERRWNSSANTR